MNPKTIGITSIGSGVGQSVIDSCRLSSLPLRTVGLGNNPLAFGAYDCDVIDSLPTIYAETYIEALLQKVRTHQISLLIPGLDDELPMLAESLELFAEVGCAVVVADPALLRLCRDKEYMSQYMARYSDTYVKSFTPDQAVEAIKSGAASLPLIAKPRGGFASRGLKIIQELADLNSLGQDLVIQEIAVPHSEDPFRPEFERKLGQGVAAQVSEISIQLLFDKVGKLLGRFASYNRLNNGVPIEVFPIEHAGIWDEMEKQIPVFQELGVRGPLNIQGRLTDKGLKFFEINARFTGITGLRAMMGFNEVEATIQAWLYPDQRGNQLLRFNPRKAGIRQTANRTVDFEENEQVLQLLDKGFHIGAGCKKKRILITGASGHLGSHLARALAQSPESYHIIAMGRSMARLESVLEAKPNVELREFQSSDRFTLEAGLLDAVLHCGFERNPQDLTGLSDSLAFTHKLFRELKKHEVKRLFNMSSRVVYEQSGTSSCTENSAIAPVNAYGLAKYATELMSLSDRRGASSQAHLNIRLAVLAGGTPGPEMVDIISKIMLKALQTGQIEIHGGQQVFDILNVNDAVRAIVELLDLPIQQTPAALNLGGTAHSLLNIANTVKQTMNAHPRVKQPVEIRVIETDRMHSITPLDTSLLKNLIAWKPLLSLEETVRETLEGLLR